MKQVYQVMKIGYILTDFIYLTISKSGNVENILQYHLKNLFSKIYMYL